jgi:hypothetical protein
LEIVEVIASRTERAEAVDVVNLERVLEFGFIEAAFFAPCIAGGTDSSEAVEVGVPGAVPFGVVTPLIARASGPVSGFGVLGAWTAALNEVGAYGGA